MSIGSSSGVRIGCRISTGQRNGLCSNSNSNTRRASDTRSSCCCQTASTRQVQDLNNHPLPSTPLQNAQTNDICDEGDRVAEQALSEWASPHLNSRNVLKAHNATVKDGPLAG